MRYVFVCCIVYSFVFNLYFFVIILSFGHQELKFEGGEAADPVLDTSEYDFDLSNLQVRPMSCFVC